MQADRCPPVVGMPEPWPPRTAEQEAASAAFWTMVCDNERALDHMTTLLEDDDAPTFEQIRDVPSQGNGLGGGIPAVPLKGFVETGRSPFLWLGDPEAPPLQTRVTVPRWLEAHVDRGAE